MKYVLISKSYRNFIIGIFSNLTEVQNYLMSFSDNHKYQKNIAISQIFLDYPFYLTEDTRGFLFHSAIEIETEIQKFISEMNAKNED